MKVDGSFSHQTKKAGFGISGNSIKKSGCITAKNAVECELLAIVIGCQLVEHAGTVKSDAEHLVIRLNKNKKIKNHCFYSEYILDLIQEKNIKLKWVSRKKNKIANLLANNARKQS